MMEAGETFRMDFFANNEGREEELDNRRNGTIIGQGQGGLWTPKGLVG